jgi:hypothetical protein
MLLVWTLKLNVSARGCGQAFASTLEELWLGYENYIKLYLGF